MAACHKGLRHAEGASATGKQCRLTKATVSLNERMDAAAISSKINQIVDAQQNRGLWNISCA